MTSRQIIKGAQTLTDWWLEGNPPVSQDHAQARANICKLCPLNQHPDLFEQFTSLALHRIRSAFALKHRMNLNLLGEDQLNICEPCGCQIQLKAWVPIEVIVKDQVKPEYFNRLHESCWIRIEVKPI